MRQPIKLIVKKGKLLINGTRPISVQYCHSVTKRTVVKTGYYIPPSFWNKKSGRIHPDLPSLFGDVALMEEALTGILRKAEDMVKFAKKKGVCPMKFLKLNLPLSADWQLQQMTTEKKENGVYGHIQDYIEEKRPDVAPSTLNVIGMMKEHLKAYELYSEIKLTFDSFDFNFYNAFVRFLTYEYTHTRKKVVVKGLRINSIGKTIKWWKSFLKHQMAKNLIPYKDLSLYKGM
jgi:hypothetical protein